MNNKQPPHKIVFVLQDLEFGGTQRYVLNLLQHLDKTIFVSELWVLRGGRDMAKIAEKTGVKIKWFSKGSWVTPSALYRFFFYLAANRPTYLYPLTVVPNVWARIFGSLLRVPIIISSYRNLVAHQYEWLLWPLSTHIICNAEAVRHKLIRKYRVKESKISVIPNGVDTDYFSPNFTKLVSPPIIIYIGRLVDQKDPLTLLESFRNIKQKIPDAQLLVVGNGPLRSLLKSFIKHHQMNQHISLVAGTTDIRKYLHQAQVFLLPSLYEGSPNIVIEAMACGLPVVATNTSGIPELIEHGINGYLVQPRDSKKMAKWTIRLLQNKDIREKMGENARKRVVKNHNIGLRVRQTEKILLHQLSGDPGNYEK